MVATTVLLLAATLSAAEMLERSIGYHDSEGRFATSAIAIELSESRRNESVRKTSIVIDNSHSRFEMRRIADDEREVYVLIEGDNVKVYLDGSTDFSKEEAEQYRLASEQAQRTRNYYIYLYGLPMKLLDPGTRLDPKTREKEYQGHAVYELKVSYDAEVGQDTWYFYLDRETYALVGYRFYHDESKNDGEYIVLEGEANGAGLKLAKTRKWYRHTDDGFLGTDTIESVRRP